MSDELVQFEISEPAPRPMPPAVAAATAPNPARGSGSFPLIALLQLAAFSAALVACIDGTVLRETLDQMGPIQLAGAIGASMVAGFIAVMFGFGHLRRWRTALAAGGVGALHAPAILAAYAAPAPFWRAGPAVAVLLVSTIVLRVRSA